MKSSKAPNDYDRVLRENLILELLDVFKLMLGIQDCELDNTSPLPAKLHRTLEREPDLVRVMKHPNGSKFILHLEFQAQNDPEMVYRNQEYHAILQRKTKLPIHHFVLYIGQQKPQMTTQLDPNLIYTGFNLIDINDLNAEKLLHSENPEEVIMAILGNFEGADPVLMITRIFQRLRSMLEDETKLKKYIYQLTILSRLRNFQNQTIQLAEAMPLTIDIDNDILYLRGRDKEKRNNARKLKELGVAIDIIAKATGLSEEEIRKL